MGQIEFSQKAAKKFSEEWKERGDENELNPFL